MQEGVDFAKKLYVPECYNGEVFLNREDHGHLLKRIATRLRLSKLLDRSLSTKPYLKWFNEDADNCPQNFEGSSWRKKVENKNTKPYLEFFNQHAHSCPKNFEGSSQAMKAES